ncbi:MAG: hypothetical protein ACO3TV_05775 [Ilumatobacteraceae bacterium]
MKPLVTVRLIFRSRGPLGAAVVVVGSPGFDWILRTAISISGVSSGTEVVGMAGGATVVVAGAAVVVGVEVVEFGEVVVGPVVVDGAVVLGDVVVEPGAAVVDGAVVFGDVVVVPGAAVVVGPAVVDGAEVLGEVVGAAVVPGAVVDGDDGVPKRTQTITWLISLSPVRPPGLYTPSLLESGHTIEPGDGSKNSVFTWKFGSSEVNDPALTLTAL